MRRYGILGGTHDDVLMLAKKLQAVHPAVALKFCYEAGPRGYPLCRFLQSHGHGCILVAPSKIPRKPGDRVKTDRRDAGQLARLHRAGELTAIQVPDPQDGADHRKGLTFATSSHPSPCDAAAPAAPVVEGPRCFELSKSPLSQDGWGKAGTRGRE